MSATELLEQVKALPSRERRKVIAGIHELEEDLEQPVSTAGKKPVHWPDAAARRKKIFGNKVLPNLVLLAREDERY